MKEQTVGLDIPLVKLETYFPFVAHRITRSYDLAMLFCYVDNSGPPFFGGYRYHLGAPTPLSNDEISRLHERISVALNCARLLYDNHQLILLSSYDLANYGYEGKIKPCTIADRVNFMPDYKAMPAVVATIEDSRRFLVHGMIIIAAEAHDCGEIISVDQATNDRICNTLHAMLEEYLQDVSPNSGRKGKKPSVSVIDGVRHYEGDSFHVGLVRGTLCIQLTNPDK